MGYQHVMIRMEDTLVVASTETTSEIFKKMLADQVMTWTIPLVIISPLITPLLQKSFTDRKTIKQHQFIIH